VIGRSARGQRIDTLKTQFAKIEFIREDIDHSHRIVLGNVILETLGQQRPLSAALTLDETLHLGTLMM
jgi:hypothetical protein